MVTIVVAFVNVITPILTMHLWMKSIGPHLKRKFFWDVVFIKYTKDHVEYNQNLHPTLKIYCMKFNDFKCTMFFIFVNFCFNDFRVILKCLISYLMNSKQCWLGVKLWMSLVLYCKIKTSILNFFHCHILMIMKACYWQ